eukprot:TRINITY_DN2423_c0_g2_i1.p1 TRINITY_DN2423_c0_g2~~TRINITY_DN2423_c0_g2_i1.p1  ORF type:complete len:430 (+),score=37.34 TRINITY_DN2423_c0_g2_i1:82-1371(+)
MAGDVLAYANFLKRDMQARSEAVIPPELRQDVARLFNRFSRERDAAPCGEPADGAWDARQTLVGPVPELETTASQPPGDPRVDKVALSLRDPLSQLIIYIPVVGHRCRHSQAFDFLTYMQVNRAMDSKPGGLLNQNRWRCPLCGGSAPTAEHLAISPLFCAALLRRAEQRRKHVAEVYCDGITASADGWWCLSSSRGRGSAAEVIDLTVDEPDLGLCKVKVEQPQPQPQCEAVLPAAEGVAEAAAAAGVAAAAAVHVCPPTPAAAAEAAPAAASAAAAEPAPRTAAAGAAAAFVPEEAGWSLDSLSVLSDPAAAPASQTSLCALSSDLSRPSAPAAAATPRRKRQRRGAPPAPGERRTPSGAASAAPLATQARRRAGAPAAPGRRQGRGRRGAAAGPAAVSILDQLQATSRRPRRPEPPDAEVISVSSG